MDVVGPAPTGAPAAEPRLEQDPHADAKLKQALDESRMMMLGTQIIVGFQFTSAFEEGFDRLAPSSRYVAAGTLLALLLVVALLAAAVPYHHLVVEGKHRADLLSFVRRASGVALGLFAASLGTAVFVASELITGRPGAIAAGAAIGALALGLWFGLGGHVRRRARPSWSSWPRRRRGGRP